MMFRKLYWVTENLTAEGRSEVKGVYTSIPDLIRYGIADSPRNVRLTLAKLDSAKEPLGRWEGPDFDGLREALQTYIGTDEFSEEECVRLVNQLSAVRV